MKGNNADAYVAPDYAVDSSVPILDSVRNANYKEDRLPDHVENDKIIMVLKTFDKESR